MQPFASPGALESAALELIEELFFERPEEAPAAGRAPAGAALAARVAFRGPRTGWLEVRADRGVLQRLAAGLLGREDERGVTAGQQELALRELARMLCRCALGRLVPEGRFQFAAPELCFAPRPDESDWLLIPLEPGTLALRMEDGGHP